MDKKFGIIMFDGRMYKLDEMSSDEIKELMIKMKEHQKNLKKEAEILAGKNPKEEGVSKWVNKKIKED